MKAEAEACSIYSADEQAPYAFLVLQDCIVLLVFESCLLPSHLGWNKRIESVVERKILHRNAGGYIQIGSALPLLSEFFEKLFCSVPDFYEVLRSDLSSRIFYPTDRGSGRGALKVGFDSNHFLSCVQDTHITIIRKISYFRFLQNG